MKLKTKLQKLTESEKNTERRRVELSKNVFDLIRHNNVDIKKLCASIGLSRSQFYYMEKKSAIPTETLKKILDLEVFQQFDK